MIDKLVTVLGQPTFSCLITFIVVTFALTLASARITIKLKWDDKKEKEQK